MIQGFRHAFRRLRRSPGFLATTVVTLGLGIGAATAIFSVVDAVLLAPLPLRDPARLAAVWEANVEQAALREGPSPGNFLDLLEDGTIFESAAAWFETALTLQGDREAEQVASAQVSVDFFETLGVPPALGRVFRGADSRGVTHDGAGQYASGDRVAVVSDGLWRRRFGADPELAGKTMTIHGQPWTVLGVMPADFETPTPGVELWVPWDLRSSYGPRRFPEGPPRDWRFLRVVGRLKPGVSWAHAQTHLDGFSAALAEQHPRANAGWRMRLVPLHDDLVGGSRPLLLALAGAVGMLLLIACANVASLLTAQGAARRREIALRSVLGASRGRIVRQLLGESLVLALSGGAAGLALTWAGRRLLVALAPPTVPRIDRVAVDLRVLAFAVAVSLATGVLFGLLPALRGTRAARGAALGEGARGVTARGSHRRFLNGLVVAEVAIALVLLAGAGLFGRSFLRQLQVDPGFDAGQRLTMHINLDAAAYRGRAAEFYAELIRRLGQLPGVESAGAVTTLPMSNVGVDFDRPYWRDGEPVPEGGADTVDVRMATPGYFRTIGMTLLGGREFTDRDRADSPAVLIVSDGFAQKVWPGRDPVGQRLVLDYNRGAYPYTVVGVTRGVRYYGLKREPRPEVFIPHAQNAYLPMNVVIRTAGPPAASIPAVKAVLRGLEPAQPGHHIVTLDELVDRSLSADRFALRLLGLLSALTLVLAATGIAGVMTYTVQQRTHELAVRISLGAQRRDVLRLIFGQGARVALAGAAIGLAATWAVTRLAQALLYETSAMDPLTLAAATALLALVVLAACGIPALRAARVDPAAALRSE